MPDTQQFGSMEPHQAPDHIAKYLDPTEKIVFFHRFHWAMLLEPMAIIVVGIITTITADLFYNSHHKDQRTGGWVVWGLWLLWTVATVWEVDRAKKHFGRVRKETNAQLLALIVVGALGMGAYYLVKSKNFGVGGLLLITLLIVCAWALREVAHWFDRHLVLTNKRIMVINGLVSKSVSSMPLPKLTDMVYHRSSMGRVLGYGLFDVESAGQDQALKIMNFVPDPDNTNLQISHLLWGSSPTEPKNIRINGQVAPGSGNISMTGQMDG